MDREDCRLAYRCFIHNNREYFEELSGRSRLLPTTGITQGDWGQGKCSFIVHSIRCSPDDLNNNHEKAKCPTLKKTSLVGLNAICLTNNLSVKSSDF